MTKPMTESPNIFPTSAETVNFHNGMIVTAEDLHTAMTYPIQLMQAVNRAVHGCGVVCGFKFAPDPKLCDRPPEPCDPCKDVDSVTNPLVYANSILEVGCGTAIDCAGLPVELCHPQRIELSPETCGCDGGDAEMCILIRRVPAFEAPRGDCCSPAEGAVACSRKRDHVEIRAFPRDELPDHTCRRDFKQPDEGECVPFSSNRGAGAAAPDPTGQPGGSPGRDTASKDRRACDLCTCLMECGECCGCCGEGWVLLGCVRLCNGKIIVDSLKPPKDADSDKQGCMGPSHPASPYFMRKWIKSIECLCGPDEEALKMTGREDRTAEKARYAEGLEALVEDREVAVQMEKDDRVYEKLDEIAGGMRVTQMSLLRTYHFRNLDHAEYILSDAKDELAKQTPFNKDKKKLAEMVDALKRRKG